MISEHTSWITLRERAFRHNVAVLRSFAGDGVLIPVVKANAYGHGLSNVAQMAKKWPVWGLAVAHGYEAFQLKKAGFHGRILVLSSWNTEEALRLAKLKAHLVVYDFTTLKTIYYLSRRAGIGTIQIHIKVDTGTTRLGFLPSDLPRLKRTILRKPKNVRVVAYWSHLSSSEDTARHVTDDQVTRFSMMRAALPPVPHAHLSCTAALIRYPDARFSMNRAGIGLYGVWPSEATKRHARHIRLEPALAWYTTIRQFKRVPAGTYVGYGRTVRLSRASTIAVIPVGYADGLPRSLSNRGFVAIRGHRCPIIGRISMNLTMVDASRTTAKVGDKVELIGPQVPVEMMAKAANTIPYEILARLSPDIPRQTV